MRQSHYSHWVDMRPLHITMCTPCSLFPYLSIETSVPMLHESHDLHIDVEPSIEDRVDSQKVIFTNVCFFHHSTILCRADARCACNIESQSQLYECLEWFTRKDHATSSHGLLIICILYNSGTTSFIPSWEEWRNILKRKSLPRATPKSHLL